MGCPMLARQANFLEGCRKRGVPHWGVAKIFLVVAAVLCLCGNGAAAIFSDTVTCTATPEIDFPSEVTVAKNFLAVFSCSAPADFNAGDFVTAWIEDTQGSPIISISEYVETETGIEWISPLSDNNGQAWDSIFIDPVLFDCNSTGVPYTIRVQWDDQAATEDFSVFCPSVELTMYRDSLPYWEKLRVEVHVTDIKGYRMAGVPCESKVLQYNENFDTNAITIKQEHAIVYTDWAGKARFEFDSGIFQDLLQGFEYNTKVSCLGTDVNFSFDIAGQDEDYLRNPLYYLLKFVSENAVPIIGIIVFGILAVGILYAIFKRHQS